MDLSVKTLGQLVFLFIAIFLILSVIVFYFTAANARDSAYAIVEYLEIRGFDEESRDTIDEYARQRNITAEISEASDGIRDTGGRIRYRVDVSFSHIFSVLGFNHRTTYTLYTRAVEY